ncbi:hypothetical protein ScPMuIL_004337 [Solemya velum]
METKIVFRMDVLVLTLLAVSLTCVLGDNNTSSGVSDTQTLVEEKRTPLEEGATPIFDMTHGFLKLLHGDKFYDTSEPINVYSVVDIVVNGTYSQFQEDWQDVASTFSAYAACFIIGLMFVVFMPVAGLIFCCCYCCCNKCGGRTQKMDPPRAKCKKTTYCTILIVFNTLMLAGAVVALIGNEILHNKFEDVEGGGLSMIGSSVTSLKTWADDTIKDVRAEGTSIIERTADNVVETVESAAKSTVNEVKKLINADSLLSDAEKLGEKAQDAIPILQEIGDSLQELKTLQDSLTTELATIKTDIGNACGGRCGSLQSQIDSLNTEANFTGLDLMESELDKVKNALNISTYVTQARQEFNNSEKTVSDKINQTVKSAQDQMTSLKLEVQKELDSLNDTASPYIQDLTDFMNQDLEDGSKYMKEYGDYIWYGGIGLSCIVALSVFFYYMGLLFGMCGQRPGYDAPCCNRGVGSNLLVAGVVFCFLFAAILMLVVLVLFVTGGLPYSLVCEVTNDGVENIEKFEPIIKASGLDLEEMFTNNTETNLTISSAVRDCKADKGVYTALQLQNFFDLDSVLDTKTVEDEIQKMVDTDINLGTVNLTKNLLDELETFSQSGIADIKFDQYEQQLDASITTVDLTQMAQNLSALSSLLSKPDLEVQAQKLRDLQNGTVTNMTTKMRDLRSSLTTLKNTNLLNLPNETTSIVDGIREAESKFNQEGSDLVKLNLKYLGGNLTDLVKERAGEIKRKVKEDIGRCRPVYDALQSSMDVLCQSFLDPLNAIWFGLGWALFFYIPTIVFALLLSSLYKREEKFDKEVYDYERSKNVNNGDYDHYAASESIPLASMDEGHRGHHGMQNAGYDHNNKGSYPNGYDRSYNNAQSLGGIQRKY